MDIELVKKRKSGGKKSELEQRKEMGEGLGSEQV